MKAKLRRQSRQSNADRNDELFPGELQKVCSLNIYTIHNLYMLSIDSYMNLVYCLGGSDLRMRKACS